ncbi:hypothetical protein Lepto7376_2219 [[Leptolyngbya] sp. PCC 7376]|uniref:DUF2325 domain-containing protein n=1 Tax=[Leptolyngbya] sp. PCC 7376 TaxID=111781 RepID=UPI00029F299B|nr:DUF2325 domain-containing protein [[Leptolyngbya] sp. PCC 7376]AFY38509.1 hypothetical protein Lepto7376_2219 [[Leptolyngbya] sp. PCC 7376]
MDVELENLEASVENLLFAAKTDLEERKLQQQRDQQYQEIVRQRESKLQPLLKKVEEMISTYRAEGYQNAEMISQLQEKADDIKKEIAEIPEKASEIVDNQLVLREERLLEEKAREKVQKWQTDLRDDLLEMVNEQNDFFSATDAAIAVRSYIDDLKELGALDEVVDALIAQINQHSEEGPVARLRGTHEQTLNFIYNKALENRSRTEHHPNIQPKSRHRKSDSKPELYANLIGKVLVFGGHDRLQTAVRNRLRNSQVELQWYSEQDGLQLSTQGEAQVNNYDLILIITGYASHSMTERAMDACKKADRSFEIIKTTGMTRVLEAIESGLKTQQLAQMWNK